MKLRILPLLLVAISLPAFPASSKKLTVAQLAQLLTSLQEAKKSDQQVAAQLATVELSEELTNATMHALVSLVPGPIATEQIYVLEARSALLPPPAADLPATPAPDPAAQQALLAKAQEYVQKTLPQQPLTASRLTARFQDGTPSIQSYTGAQVKAVNDQDPIFDATSTVIHLKNTHTDTVHIAQGTIQPATKENIAWGRNGFVTSTQPPMPLPELLEDVAAAGNPAWLRWQLLQGKPAAVFSFSVDKKRSHYSLNYCCFPDTSNFGNNLFNPHAFSPGDISTVSEWKPFTAKAGYHGQLFLDPTTGTVLRTIVEAEFKSSDPVHNEQMRVDYAQVAIAGQPQLIPIRTFTLAEIVPNADSFAAKYAVRHDLVTEDFKDFTPTEKTPQPAVK